MSERGNEGAPPARPDRGNEGAPPAQPDEGRRRGGLPWGRILAVVIGLLLLALVIPLACQALTGGSGNGGDAGGGAGGQQESTGTEQDTDEGAGAGSGATTPETTDPEGETTGAAEQQASEDDETTTPEAPDGVGGEQAGAASDGAVTAGFGAAAGGGAVGQVGDQGSALDQTGDGTSVVIPQATISGTDGWMVVHRDEGGQPGAVIGATALREGQNTEVIVPLEEPVGTSQRLHAMIHADDPADGAYTFPDGDPPAESNGEPVVESFRYTVGTLAAGEPMPDTGGPAWLTLVGGAALICGLLLMFGGPMLWRLIANRGEDPARNI